MMMVKVMMEDGDSDYGDGTISHLFPCDIW
jgi:hypothetical protein